MTLAAQNAFSTALLVSFYGTAYMVPNSNVPPFCGAGDPGTKESAPVIGSIL
jgi:hypothetical protein